MLDRLTVGGVGARRTQRRDRLGGEVLERNPASIGLRGDRAGRQVDRDEMVSARMQKSLDLVAARDVGVQSRDDDLRGR